MVIPTYNEAANVRTVLNRVLALDGEWSVIIVDDGSPDGTADIVREFQTDYPDRVGLLERAGKQGLGTAYLAGFRAALEAGFAFVCEMDADLSHNPADLVRLAATCGGPNAADLAVGSRYVDGVRVIDWPLGRLVLSYAAGVYTRMVTRLPIRDVTAGFACFRREVLETLDLSRVRSNGYSFQIEMKYRAWRAGFRLVEVPIVFTERTEGQSKMSSAIVREAVTKVWQLRLASLTGRL